jgi:hypothetical protein
MTLDYKIVDAKDKDVEIITSMKLVTMIDDEMDKVLSYNEKEKIKKNITRNINLTYLNYKMIMVNNRIAGAYVVVPYKDGDMIDQIYLFPEYRNNGIASAIVNKLKENNRNLYAWMYKNNNAAYNLFAGLGFRTYKETERNIFMKYDFLISLQECLDGIKHGYCDIYGNKYITFHDKFKEEYCLQRPEEVLENKMGINFDLVELERDILSTRDVDLRTYLMMSSNKDEDNSHAFLVYKDDKYYYWYEYSWLKYRGIHRYNNKENLFRDILNKYSKVINCEVEDIKLYMYDKPRYGINYNKFIRHVLAGSENLNK